MQKEISYYLDMQKTKVKQKISDLLTATDGVKIARRAFKSHFSNTKSSAFHSYYSETISNKKLFLSDSNFFGRFKQQYSLQGIDRGYLKHLENNKMEILQLIETDEISTLYFKFFAEALIQHGKNTKTKSLGSFFSKLVHTFAPDKYCALDNPIKKYFGLGNEGFYITFIVISESYKEWSSENTGIIDKIKHELKSHIKEKPSNSNITNLKLLDLIFWYQANI